ncbi:hypothetical protein D3C86_1751380 [compost metagenome]
MFGLAVLIIHVIGVLPYIDSEIGRAADSNGVLAVLISDQRELVAVVTRQPHPARAEDRIGDIDRTFDETVIVTEGLVYRSGKITRRPVRSARNELVPIGDMVPGLRGIVEDFDISRLF